MYVLRQVRRRLLNISRAQTTTARRRFRVDRTDVRQRLERIGQTFLVGYHAALSEATPVALAKQLNTVENEWRGFAFEGAGMALALLDQLTPWQPYRLRTFLAGPAARHTYIVHVGAGWALALLRRRVERPLRQMDPLLRWLAVDGYGFYGGYFHWPRTITHQRVPRRLTGYACRAFDQGLGRSLWFVEGANVERIAAMIATFPCARHADLWSGVGLACAYAGGVERAALGVLRESAGAHRSSLAQGVAFAARARQKAGNQAEHTKVACDVLCGMSADAAAEVAAVTSEYLPYDGHVPAYEVWRQRLQERFAHQATMP